MKPLDRPGHPPGLTEHALADAGRSSEGSGPVERVRRLPVTLPCVGCHHAPVCSIRPGLEALVFTAPEPPHGAIHITPTVKVTCDYARTKRGAEIGAKLRAGWTPERRAAQAERLRVQREKAKDL
jgi:hypothetical protein